MVKSSKPLGEIVSLNKNKVNKKRVEIEQF